MAIPDSVHGVAFGASVHARSDVEEIVKAFHWDLVPFLSLCSYSRDRQRGMGKECVKEN